MPEEEEIYQMSPEEIAAVEEGIWQLDNGFSISDEEAKRQVEEWLKIPYEDKS